jgi:anti-sigma factor RsiW
MSHESWTAKLDAYLDGELAAGEITQLDAHLRHCPECAAEGLRRLQWKRTAQVAGQRYKAEPALREKIQKTISKQKRGRAIWRWWPAAVTAVALALVLAGLGIVELRLRGVRDNQIVGEIVDLHVSTLASSTPVDVLSSDRHTVKPWFEGKIPFTFNLPELENSPFELVGGRVSYLEQAPGAELVFRIRKHQITAFIFQQNALPSSFPAETERDARSFHFATWRREKLRFFVIGDAPTEDMRALRDLLKKAP